MDARLIALKLFLDELGIAADLSTFANRKTIQKAVYLGQYAGADLGYRFVWDKMGPFSENLARDYYRLAEALNVGSEDYKSRILRPVIRESLEEVKPLVQPPTTWEGMPQDWLELVASVHYLSKVSKLTGPETRTVLKAEKPTLAPFIDVAATKLGEVPRLHFENWSSDASQH